MSTPLILSIVEYLFAPMALRSILARNLRSLRAERQMSQEALASKASIDRTYVSALERERYAVSIDTLEKLADALGVPAAELLRL